MTNYQQYSDDLIVGLCKLPQEAADRFSRVISRLGVPLHGEYAIEQSARKQHSKSDVLPENHSGSGELPGKSAEN